MILDPNGMPILQPTVDNAETATFNDAFAAIGNAVVAVENVRQIQTYKWADNAARTAQTGMVAGDEGYQTDTDTYYTYDGAAWNDSVPESHLQLDTTNSVAKMVTQYGVGKITGTGANNMIETVTFPVAFASVPVVIVNTLGFRATGAYNPTSLSTAYTLLTTAQSPTLTTISAAIYQTTGGGLGAGNDFYYSWSATGVLA